MSPAGSGHTGSGGQMPSGCGAPGLPGRRGGPELGLPPAATMLAAPSRVSWVRLSGVHAGRGGFLSYSDTGAGAGLHLSARAAPFPAALRRSDLTTIVPFTLGSCPRGALPGVTVVVARSRHWNHAAWILPGGCSWAVLPPGQRPIARLCVGLCVGLHSRWGGAGVPPVLEFPPWFGARG